jgi:hypothetical protein
VLPKVLERWGCLWIFLAVLALIFGIAAIFPPRPQQQKLVTWADYQACIADVVARCVSDGIQRDLKRSREELPVMPSRQERQADCRAQIPGMEAIDRLFPENEPMCQKPKNSN